MRRETTKLVGVQIFALRTVLAIDFEARTNVELMHVQLSISRFLNFRKLSPLYIVILALPGATPICHILAGADRDFLD